METTTYYFDGNPDLHHSIRTYFDCFGVETEERTFEEKILDLAVAFHAGIDLKPRIDDMIENHPEMDKCTVQRVILEYIDYLRTGNKSDLTWLAFFDDESVPYETFLNLLKQEIAIRFTEGYASWDSHGAGHFKQSYSSWTFENCFKTKIYWDFDAILKGMTKKQMKKRLLEPTLQVGKENVLFLKH